MNGRMVGFRRALSVAVAVSVSAIGLGACGSSSSPNSDPAKPNYQGGVASPQVKAPPLKLDNSLGQPVNIANYRGNAVLVTFIYTHCPDICPLIVGHLHSALEKLGPDANKFQIIAVSVDPKGDT